MKKNKRNFYKVLNVKQDAGPSEIKRAYRSAAKRYHPDVSSENAEKFKQVQEAYETLSNPGKKTLYDGQLMGEHKPTVTGSEPSTRDDLFFSFFDRMDPFAGLSDSWSDFVSDFFFEEANDRREHYVEILLTPEEAREGGKISLHIPIEMVCSRCLGAGRVGRLICGRCRGQGEETLEKRFVVTIPPGVSDGMEARISPGGSKARPIEIIAIIRVSPH